MVVWLLAGVQRFARWRSVELPSLMFVGPTASAIGVFLRFDCGRQTILMATNEQIHCPSEANPVAIETGATLAHRRS